MSSDSVIRTLRVVECYYFGYIVQ